MARRLALTCSFLWLRLPLVLTLTRHSSNWAGMRLGRQKKLVAGDSRIEDIKKMDKKNPNEGFQKTDERLQKMEKEMKEGFQKTGESLQKIFSYLCGAFGGMGNAFEVFCSKVSWNASLIQ